MTPHGSTRNEATAQDDSYGYKAMNKHFESNTGRGSLLCSNRKANQDERPANDYVQQRV